MNISITWLPWSRIVQLKHKISYARCACVLTRYFVDFEGLWPHIMIFECLTLQSSHKLIEPHEKYLATNFENSIMRVFACWWVHIHHSIAIRPKLLRHAWTTVLSLNRMKMSPNSNLLLLRQKVPWLAFCILMRFLRARGAFVRQRFCIVFKLGIKNNFGLKNSHS